MTSTTRWHNLFLKEAATTRRNERLSNECNRWHIPLFAKRSAATIAFSLSVPRRQCTSSKKQQRRLQRSRCNTHCKQQHICLLFGRSLAAPELVHIDKRVFAHFQGSNNNYSQWCTSSFAWSSNDTGVCGCLVHIVTEATQQQQTTVCVHIQEHCTTMFKAATNSVTHTRSRNGHDLGAGALATTASTGAHLWKSSSNRTSTTHSLSRHLPSSPYIKNCNVLSVLWSSARPKIHLEPSFKAKSQQQTKRMQEKD